MLKFLRFGTDDPRYYSHGRLFKSSGGGSTTTVQKSDPPAYLQPYLVDTAKKAQWAYNQVPTDGYSGQLTATPTAAQLQAINMQKQIASGLSGLGDTTNQLASNQANKVLTGGYTAPANNQFQTRNVATTDAVNAYLQPVKQNLQENILPQLESQAIKSGAYGGNRYTTEQGKQVNDNFTTQANNIAAQMGYTEATRQEDQRFDSWKTNQALMPELLKLEQTAALTSPELANQGLNQNLQQSNILNNAGTAEQLNAQDALDELYNQYMLQVQGPFAGLDQYASIINGGNVGGTSTATGKAPASGGSFLSGALGGGTAGFGLASALSLSNPWTAAAVGGGALLGGLFS